MNDSIIHSSQKLAELIEFKSIRLNNLHIEFASCQWKELRSLHKDKDWWIDIIDFLEAYTDKTNTITLRTSGSTGESKIMVVEKYKLYNSALKTVDYFGLNDLSKGLLCLSANYIAGKMMLIRAIVSGMHLICVEPKANPVERIEETIDFAAMVPMQAEASLKTPKSFSKIKQLIIGGGAVKNSLIDKLNRTSVSAYETFGMTETFSHIAIRQLTPKLDPYFTPLKDVSIMQGYDDVLVIDSPDIGAHKLKTTDIIALKPRNQFQWLGRTDFVINSGGIKINPESIESQIAQIIDKNFCISSITDEKLGDKLMLIIEGETFNTKILEKEINELLESYHQPKQIVFMAQFPLTESGKIKRKELQKLI